MSPTLVNRDGQPVDRIGRRLPHRLNAITFERAIPGFLARFIDVPVKAWTVAAGIARAACPCGQNIAINPGRMHGCTGCERVYLFTGKTLHVGNSPVRKEAA